MIKKQKTTLFKRKREGKTDYRKRLKLLLSNKPRVVIRKSLKNMLIQIIEYNADGDKVIVSVSSKKVEKTYGWKTNKGNIPTAYLTGLVAGKNAVEKGVKEAVLDIGLSRSTKGSRIYAALKGVIDAGLKVPHSKDVLPSEDSLGGSTIAKYASILKKKSKEEYEKLFADYLKNKNDPEELPKLFKAVKKSVEER